jgi:hypothetical protein
MPKSGEPDFRNLASSSQAQKATSRADLTGPIEVGLPQGTIS